MDDLLARLAPGKGKKPVVVGNSLIPHSEDELIEQAVANVLQAVHIGL